MTLLPYLKLLSPLAIIILPLTMACIENVISTPTQTKTSAPKTFNAIMLDAPSASSTIAVSPNGKLVVAINPDSDSITIVDPITLKVLTEITVGNNPRTLAITPDSREVIITNHDDGTISIVDLSNFTEITRLKVGPMPYGVVSDGKRAYVSEFAKGNIIAINLKTGSLDATIKVDPFPSGLALGKDSELLLATHFFTGNTTAIDLKTLSIRSTITTGNDTNLSQFVIISPDGTRAYLPQTRSNTTNTALLFDTTLFPIVNVLDLSNYKLIVQERITLDTADEPVNMPFSVALSPDGKTLYLVNAGSNDMSVVDLTTNRGIKHLPLGANPRGIAITPDGSRLFVNNVLDGTLSVINASKLTYTDTVNITDIPLPYPILLGKKIFNSASEPNLTTDNWISCATCHFDGGMDTRTWLGFPDGPRNTPALFGVAHTLPIHWSGDLDELQDVEITIRDIQFGTGLVPGESHDSLGLSHAGLSTELDALTLYLASLEVKSSPHSDDHVAIGRGEAVFNTAKCVTCHTPPIYTDQQLHDVGTGDASVEKNSHGHGTYFDTPSLLGIWATAPYFHDGSATTLLSVFESRNSNNVHEISTDLTDQEINDLIKFLLSLPLTRHE